MKRVSWFSLQNRFIANTQKNSKFEYRKLLVITSSMAQNCDHVLNKWRVNASASACTHKCKCKHLWVCWCTRLTCARISCCTHMCFTRFHVWHVVSRLHTCHTCSFAKLRLDTTLPFACKFQLANKRAFLFIVQCSASYLPCSLELGTVRVTRGLQNIVA